MFGFINSESVSSIKIYEMTFRILFQISVLLLTLQRGTSTGKYYNNRVTVTGSRSV